MVKKLGKFNNSRASRPKKRKFSGNRFTGEHSEEYTCASAAKLKKTDEYNISVDPTFQYCILQFSVFTYLQTILKCNKM